MTFIFPLTEDEKRRRRRASGETIEDGEYIGFDLAFRDSKPGTTHLYLTDAGGEAGAGTLAMDSACANANAIRALTGRAPRSTNPRLREIQDQAAREHAEKRRVNDAAVQAAVEKYAPRPKFTTDSDALAHAAAVRDAARQAQYQQPPTPTPAPSSSIVSDEARLASGAAVRDAARAAAYGR